MHFASAYHLDQLPPRQRHPTSRMSTVRFNACPQNEHEAARGVKNIYNFKNMFRAHDACAESRYARSGHSNPSDGGVEHLLLRAMKKNVLNHGGSQTARPNFTQEHTRYHFKSSNQPDTLMATLFSKDRACISAGERKENDDSVLDCSEGGIQWLFDAAKKGAISARDNAVYGMHGNFLNPYQCSQDMSHYQQLCSSQAFLNSEKNDVSDLLDLSNWDFNRVEDLIDESVFFTRAENVRRRSKAYRWQTKQLHDLHISMPICIPYGRICIESPLGACFYEFDRTKDGGAHMLFGKGMMDASLGIHTPESRREDAETMKDLTDSVVVITDPDLTRNEADEGSLQIENQKLESHCTLKNQETNLNQTDCAHHDISDTTSKKAHHLSEQPQQLSGTHEAESLTVSEAGSHETKNMMSSSQASKAADMQLNSACDVWASFLNIRLGTLYNLSEDQVVDVISRFHAILDKSLFFYKPISLDCRGLYPSTDQDMSHKKLKSSNAFVQERYETHGFPTTANDAKRFKMIRSFVKKFAWQLVNELNFNQAELYPQFVDASYPCPCIELHDNLRALTVDRGALKIIVREWSRLENPEIFKKIWNKQLGLSPNQYGVADTVWMKILEDKDIPSARVFTGEIRLESDHSRMVDPRWRDELVIGRRIADFQPDSQIPAISPLGRYVFCNRIKQPKIIYNFGDENTPPLKLALQSRLADVYQAHVTALELQAKSKQFFDPQSRQEQAESEAATSEQRQKSNLDEFFKASPVSEVKVKKEPSGVCKFYLSSTGCARGDSCLYLHPVDTMLETLIDIRTVPPQHPMFF